MTPSGTGSLRFVDVTADGSSWRNSEEYKAVLSAEIQPNALKLIGQPFRVQMDNDPKRNCKNS